MGDKTITVGIGRNVGDAPMTLDTWEAFQEAAVVVAVDLGGIIHSKGTGTGYWDGGAEECFTLVASVPDEVQVTLDLIGRYSVLAQQYGQEAIALTFGTTTFCTGTPDYETLVI